MEKEKTAGNVHEYKADDQLVIRSDKENITSIVYVLVFAFVCFCICCGPKVFPFWAGGLFLILSIFALGEIITCGPVYVLEKNGITICFYRYKRFYQWDDFVIKRWENYTKWSSAPNHTVHRYKGKMYYEGVLFSRYALKRNKTFGGYHFSIKKLFSFLINFYPYGISPGHGDYHALRKNRWDIFGEERLPEYNAVEKEVFVNYMKLWGVEIEGLSMDTDNIRYANRDGGID